MKHLLVIAALAAALGLARAQTPSPTPAPTAAPAALPDLEISAGETSSGDPAALRKEVNLADTESAESMEIPPPADSPDPDKTGEITEELPGDEDPRKTPPVTGTVEVTAKNNGQVVNAAVGNLVRITLESNPSTGYNWELRDFDYGAATFHGSDLVARKTGNVLFGAPGDTVITLQAVQPGSQKIEAVYRRPWEAPDKVAAAFSFQLEVAGDAAAPETTPAP